MHDTTSHMMMVSWVLILHVFSSSALMMPWWLLLSLCRSWHFYVGAWVVLHRKHKVQTESVSVICSCAMQLSYLSTQSLWLSEYTHIACSWLGWLVSQANQSSTSLNNDDLAFYNSQTTCPKCPNVKCPQSSSPGTRERQITWWAPDRIRPTKTWILKLMADNILTPHILSTFLCSLFLLFLT